MVECRKYKLYQLLLSQDDTLVGVLSSLIVLGKFLKWSATEYIYMLFSGRCVLGPQCGPLLSFACVYTSKDVHRGPRSRKVFLSELHTRARMLSTNTAGPVRTVFLYT